MEVILTNHSLIDIREFVEYKAFDADCGDSNDFEVKIDTEFYNADLQIGNAIYIPGTECGGFIGGIGSDTDSDTITLTGLTWRGLLDKKVIIPTGDYYTVSGDLADIVNEIIGGYFDSVFVADQMPTGKVITSDRFDRYCTVLEGLTKLLKKYGYRLNLEYRQNNVIVSAQPIRDYSDEIELSQDSQLSFTTERNRQGCTTLICLGKGELSARDVAILYAQPDGTVSTEKYYTGIDEIQETYEYSNAENHTVLVEKGTEELLKRMNSNKFSMDVEQLNIDVAIGDVIGGRDYITGLYMTSPVKSIVWRVDGDEVSLDYTLEGSK